MPYPLRIAAAVAGYFALFVAALVVFLQLYPDRAISWTAATLSKATGRELRVGGPCELRLLSWRPRIVLSHVTFANPDWSAHEEMLDAGRVQASIALRALLRGRTVLPLVRIEDTTIRLEQRRDGTNNWTLWAAEAAAPDGRSEVPAIRRLDLRSSRILYAREGAESGADLQIATMTGHVAREVRLSGNGRYQNNPARVVVRAGSIAELQDEDFAFPVDAEVVAGPTTASMKGHLVGGVASGGMDVTMSIRGQTLSELYPLIGVVLPKSPPYTLTGKLGHEGKVWSFRGFDGRMGDSDLSGDLEVDTAPERPRMTADFRSKLLDLDDLAGLVGAPPATGAGETATAEQKAEVRKTAAEGRLIPEQPIEVPRLHAMDIDARLVATRVQAPDRVPIDRLDLHLTLKDGVLRAEPASFSAAGGRIDVTAALNSNVRPVRVDVDLKARDVEAARILGDTPFTKETSGKLGGSAKLAMTGNSLRALAGSADGNVQLAMADARVSHLLIELMGLDVMESVKRFVQGDEPIEVRCAAFDIRATDGKLRSELAVIDTDDTNIEADVTLDLSTERLVLRVKPHPKDVSLLSLRQNLLVEGRLADLDYYPDPLKLGPVKGTMQKFNYLLAPIVGILTPFDLASGRRHGDNGCAKFLVDRGTTVSKSSVARTGKPGTSSSRRSVVSSSGAKEDGDGSDRKGFRKRVGDFFSKLGD